LVKPSYFIAFGYCAADAANAGMRASSMAATPKKPISDESKELQSIIGETERKLKSKNSSNVNIASSVPFVVFDTLCNFIGLINRHSFR